MLKHFGFQPMRVRKSIVIVDWYYERASALHGNDIIEEPDAVIPHVRICVGASQ
jgi:hypothetical protein